MNLIKFLLKSLLNGAILFTLLSVLAIFVNFAVSFVFSFSYAENPFGGLFVLIGLVLLLLALGAPKALAEINNEK